MGTRVAIVGPNGAGKSTLLNLLAGDLVPIEVQYLFSLHPDQEGLSKQEAFHAVLGKFGLLSHNHLTPIAKLSGGQKSRVVFASVSMSKPHILPLDESTNHLDMQSIDALAEALDEFTGGVVLVSHDSRLISRVCEDEERSEIWLVEDDTVQKFSSIAEIVDGGSYIKLTRPSVSSFRLLLCQKLFRFLDPVSSKLVSFSMEFTFLISLGNGEGLVLILVPSNFGSRFSSEGEARPYNLVIAYAIDFATIWGGEDVFVRISSSNGDCYPT
ncbi:ABC-transporter [Parasponia andersonii]|uniref:ABC-transporter n=1 Tax=Parasponia andersonii TaxID=3476 RepID=A0A2P5AAK9_PARAD|nr:ABC-transporter [Parasponia andersonii]